MEISRLMEPMKVDYVRTSGPIGRTSVELIVKNKFMKPEELMKRGKKAIVIDMGNVKAPKFEVALNAAKNLLDPTAQFDNIRDLQVGIHVCMYGGMIYQSCVTVAHF